MGMLGRTGANVKLHFGVSYFHRKSVPPRNEKVKGANERVKSEGIVDAIPSLQGRPRHRPDCVCGDRGYDAEGNLCGVHRSVGTLLKVVQGAFASPSSESEILRALLQFRILRFGFLQDGDVTIGIFPES
jgi:hypothetical protein